MHKRMVNSQNEILKLIVVLQSNYLEKLLGFLNRNMPGMTFRGIVVTKVCHSFSSK